MCILYICIVYSIQRRQTLARWRRRHSEHRRRHSASATTSTTTNAATSHNSRVQCGAHALPQFDFSSPTVRACERENRARASCSSSVCSCVFCMSLCVLLFARRFTCTPPPQHHLTQRTNNTTSTVQNGTFSHRRHKRILVSLSYQTKCTNIRKRASVRSPPSCT